MPMLSVNSSRGPSRVVPPTSHAGYSRCGWLRLVFESPVESSLFPFLGATGTATGCTFGQIFRRPDRTSASRLRPVALRKWDRLQLIPTSRSATSCNLLKTGCNPELPVHLIFRCPIPFLSPSCSPPCIAFAPRPTYPRMYLVALLSTKFVAMRALPRNPSKDVALTARGNSKSQLGSYPFARVLYLYL